MVHLYCTFMSHNQNIPLPNDFSFLSQQQLRFSDTDAVGHVNNAVFATLFEAGRVEVLFGPEHPKLAENTQFVIAKLSIDFLGELNWPGNVSVGSTVCRVGNSSFDLFQGMFAKDKCVATCHSVIVVMDETTRRSSPLSAEVAAFYRSHLQAS